MIMNQTRTSINQLLSFVSDLSLPLWSQKLQFQPFIFSNNPEIPVSIFTWHNDWLFVIFSLQVARVLVWVFLSTLFRTSKTATARSAPASGSNTDCHLDWRLFNEQTEATSWNRDSYEVEVFGGKFDGWQLLEHKQSYLKM